MTMRFRTVSMLMLALAMMAQAGCDHYNCSSGANFGSSSCTGGTLSLGGGGGTTGNATAAFAFAVDEAGTIDGYTLNTTAGTFQATSGYTAPTVPTSELGLGMVVAQTQFLYAAFAGTGQIFGWTIGSGGGLTTIAGSPFAASYLIGGVDGGPESVIVNPAGTFLFVENTSGESIHVYSIGSGGVLSEVSGSPFAIPFFPANMATDGQGKYLYVTENLGGTNSNEVGAYSINSSTGALTAVSGSPFPYAMWQVQGEPTGNYLIGITGELSGDSHLYVFTISQSTGAITQSQAVSTVYLPYSIAVQPNTGGNLVYSFSINSDSTGFNPIEGYALSGGTLTAVSGSPFSNVSDGSWGQFDQTGALLFPYADIYDPSTGVTTIQLGADDVASTGALTQPVSPAALATAGVWVVTDAP